MGTAVLDGSGGWQFQVESALTEGDHFFTAVITASGGTEGTRSSYFKLTVDLTAPTTGNSVAITSYLDDVAPNEGEFTSGVPTNDTSPLLQGTVSGLQTGDRVLIFLDDVLRGSAVLDDTGGWSFQLTGLSERTYICQAVIADAAGNRGTASADFTLTIDVTPPTAGNSVAIDSYYDETPLNIGSFP